MVCGARTVSHILAAKAVIAGLSSASVVRLKQVVNEIQNHPQFVPTMQLLSVCFSVNSGELRNCMTNKLPPLIPYLGLYQTDLVKIYEGNKKRLANNLINFQRCVEPSISNNLRIRLIGKVLREVARCQKTAHVGLTPNRVVQVCQRALQILKKCSATHQFPPDAGGKEARRNQQVFGTQRRRRTSPVADHGHRGVLKTDEWASADKLFTITRNMMQKNGAMNCTPNIPS